LFVLKDKKRFEEILASRNMNKSKLSFATGITANVLYQAISGRMTIYPKWRKKISEVLGTEESELFTNTVVHIDE
jgi:hypothetical protein